MTPLRGRVRRTHPRTPPAGHDGRSTACLGAHVHTVERLTPAASSLAPYAVPPRASLTPWSCAASTQSPESGSSDLTGPRPGQ